MSQHTRRLPCLIFAQSMFPTSFPPGTERPEPYGFPLKEGNFFRADEDLAHWERYIGWHDWAVQLNCEVERVSNDARACLEGWHPVSQADDGDGDLSFSELLMVGLPQFFLCVWELGLNGWSRLIPNDPVSRVLLEVRDRRPVSGYRSAVDAAFATAFTLARVLEQRPSLRDGLAALRQRHARQQAAHPWCWLRFSWEREQAFSILCLLQDELRRWQGSSIVTPDQRRCERWHAAAQQRFLDLMQADRVPDWSKENAVPSRCNPGFDWLLTLSATVDVKDLAQCILRALEDYDPGLIVEELANEFELFSQFQNRLDREQELRADWKASVNQEQNERLHIDDIDSFAEVRTVPPSAVAQFLTDGRIEVSEDSVKRAIEEILDVPFHHKDRPNELNDVSTANVIVNGSRRPTAFMLKGPGIRKKEMTIADCGKNGDQLVRLFDTPADLFVVQFVGPISEMVIKDVKGKIDALRQRVKHAQFLIMDGQDTARLLFAYGKLNLT